MCENSVDILYKLKEKYKSYFRDDIISADIIQTKDKVYLEIVLVNKLEKEVKNNIIKRVNLDIIRENEDGDLTFNPEVNIEINAEKFINDLTPFIIANVFN